MSATSRSPAAAISIDPAEPRNTPAYRSASLTLAGSGGGAISGSDPPPSAASSVSSAKVAREIRGPKPFVQIATPKPVAGSQDACAAYPTVLPEWPSRRPSIQRSPYP
ncbi:MAG: hypothetical protein WD834_07160 [Actinomycetota bacterium]